MAPVAGATAPVVAGAPAPAGGAVVAAPGPGLIPAAEPVVVDGEDPAAAGWVVDVEGPCEEVVEAPQVPAVLA